MLDPTADIMAIYLAQTSLAGLVAMEHIRWIG